MGCNSAILRRLSLINLTQQLKISGAYDIVKDPMIFIQRPTDFSSSRFRLDSIPIDYI